MDNYRVIARRWRPKTFQDLVGQESIVQTLSNAIQSKRIAHAYLFVGPRGTGKTSTARLFAMALNCENGPRLDFDPGSLRCRAILQGQSLDVIEIDGASNNSVEQIRSLREDCQYAPAESPFKIYILDEVHMLSTAAFNALLKTLEEPPSHVKFIFATTEIYKVPTTILSRCQHFEFYPLSPHVIQQHLRHIVDCEQVEAEEEALAIIAQLAEGGMRDAQSMLDQVLAFCDGPLTREAVRAMYGLATTEIIRALASYIEQEKYAEILGVVDDIVKNGCDSYRVLKDLQNCFHERFMHAAQQNTSSISPFVYTKILEILKTGEESIQKGLSVRNHLESILFRAVECIKLTSVEKLLKILNDAQEVKKNFP
ncbi:MAG: DNA polymerase III subunit gamma/tau [Puniceicoccales bacterium]|jgi:DNA polymerase-3 subunit gamma/tau|nr:DNA polymerase III subunit gamma/tau [Puniceicoccales bacterium]